MKSNDPQPALVSETLEIKVHFYSFFKELAGCSSTSVTVRAGSTLASFAELIFQRFPRLEPMSKSMLMAVGVEYQDRNYALRSGDEVSLFPPVQGG